MHMRRANTNSPPRTVPGAGQSVPRARAAPSADTAPPEDRALSVPPFSGFLACEAMINICFVTKRSQKYNTEKIYVNLILIASRDLRSAMYNASVSRAKLHECRIVLGKTKFNKNAHTNQ